MSLNESIVKVFARGLLRPRSNARVFLASVCTDGVSYEDEWISTMMDNFLQGKTDTVGAKDCNHNLKALRGVLVFGTSILFIGAVHIDKGIYTRNCVRHCLYLIISLVFA